MTYRSLCPLFFLICLIGLATTSGAHGILNGDFESGQYPWSFRRGWSLDCTQAHSGRCSAQYQTDRSKYTPIAKQRFHMGQAGFCQFTVWIRTNLQDAPFWSDGEPTRTGLSVQVWDLTGQRSNVPLDLARQDVYRQGYRGQAGRQGWTQYTGQIPMAAGDWEIRLYLHPVRSRVGGQLRWIDNAKGRAWVDDIVMAPVEVAK